MSTCQTVDHAKSDSAERAHASPANLLHAYNVKIQQGDYANRNDILCCTSVLSDKTRLRCQTSHIRRDDRNH